MGNVVFPEYVETFIEATNRYLGFFDAKLEEVTENPKIDARGFRIAAGDIPVRVDRSQDESVV